MSIFSYSATHTNLYNLLYSLNPVKAYDPGIVKQIEVNAIQTENDFNSGYLELESITRTSNNIKAKLKLDVLNNSSIKRKSVSVTCNTLNLFKLNNENPRYDGLQVYEIDFGGKQYPFQMAWYCNPVNWLAGLMMK